MLNQINQSDFPQLEPVSGQPQTDCLWFDAEQPEQGVAAIRDIMIKNNGIQASPF
jgi:exodeoxyribonuclease V alpha subunit